ncbi:hypothetical protein ZHAS_00017243 [Anopheles sinensis]|uniref:Uncharacterized protein n=1 Tax=Anopheles sinensis TaxID=74873 RepID=A0A084WFU9_ANOSI|nr:hypothetical protein ZHAS_00017243 [Anopheles sinensis]
MSCRWVGAKDARRRDAMLRPNLAEGDFSVHCQHPSVREVCVGVAYIIPPGSHVLSHLCPPYRAIVPFPGVGAKEFHHHQVHHSGGFPIIYYSG